MSEIAGPTKPLPFRDAIVGEISPEQALRRIRATNPPRKLRTKHKILLTLVEAGWKQRQVAEYLGMTMNRVNIIANSPRADVVAYRQTIANRVLENALDVGQMFKVAAPRAAMVLIDQMSSKDEKVQAVAAKDILDRAGYSPVRRQVNVNAPVPIEALEGILGKIAEANEVVVHQDKWRIANPQAKEA